MIAKQGSHVKQKTNLSPTPVKETRSPNQAASFGASGTIMLWLGPANAHINKLFFPIMPEIPTPGGEPAKYYVVRIYGTFVYYFCHLNTICSGSPKTPERQSMESRYAAKAFR